MNRPIWRCPAMRANAKTSMSRSTRLPIVFATIGACLLATPLHAGRTQKPPLHARHWIAITGKPLSAEAGAMMFQKGGNAVDAACAMLGAVTTMWDVLTWGGETQALIYHPGLKKVIGRDGGVLPLEGVPLPARVRGARRDHARHSRRPDDDARRVRHAVARRGSGAGDPDGRRLPDRGGDGGEHRAIEGADQEVEVLEGRLPAAPRPGEGGAGGRRALRAEGSRRDPAPAGGGGGAG